MDPNETNPSAKSPESSAPFSQRPVNQPIFGTQFQSELPSRQQPNAQSGLRAFYSANRWYIWAIVAGLLIIGVLAFLAFRPSGPEAPQEAAISLTVEAPSEVAIGGEMVYRVVVDNQDTQDLKDAQLEVTYPSGTTYVSSQPKAYNSSGTVYKLPTVVPRENPTIFIKTKVTGAINDSKELKLRLTYKLGSSNIEFAKEQYFAFRLTASNIGLEMEGPTQTSNAQLVTFTVRYKNNSQEAVRSGRVSVTYPAGFNFASAQPQPDLGNNTWSIAQLEPGGEGSIQLQGTFAGSQPGESKTMNAEFSVLGNGGTYFPQAQTSMVTSLSALPLVLIQEVEARDGVVKPGDRLTFTLRYQNSAQVEAKAVNIQATLVSKALDLQTLRAEGASINNGTILWNAASIPQLESLSPNEQGTVTFSVNVKDPATRDSSKNLTVVSTAEISATGYDTPFPGNKVELKVSSPATLDTALSFVDGSQPPQVGTNSLYKVRIQLKNASNDYSDGTVTMFLPNSGSFQNNSVLPASENGKVEFDPATGKLTWNFGALPAHAGTFGQAKYIEFNVNIHPSSSQVGDPVTLVKDIRMQGRDIFTGQTVELTASNITTNDLSGNNYGRGEVVE